MLSHHTRFAHTRPLNWLVLLVCLSSMVLGSNCGRRAGKYEIVSVPIRSVARTLQASRKGNNFELPVLCVYDSDGALVYNGTNAPDNNRTIRSLPAGLARLRPLTGGAPLRDLFEAIPELRVNGPRAPERGHPLILSVELVNCGACVEQAKALSASQTRLLRQGFDVVVISVTL